MKWLVRVVILGLSAMLLLAACQQQNTAVSAVEAYVKARGSSDASQLQALSCKDWEGQASIEADSFKSMNAQINNLSCAQSGSDSQFTYVTCQGQLLTTYNGETRNRDLAEKAFKSVQEDGQWKMCGYK